MTIGFRPCSGKLELMHSYWITTLLKTILSIRILEILIILAHSGSIGANVGRWRVRSNYQYQKILMIIKMIILNGANLFIYRFT